MSTILPTYTPTNAVSPARLLLGFIGVVVGALILAYIYALIIYWSPIVYLNLIVCGVFGFALLLMSNAIADFAHVRARKWRVLLALTAGILGWYFHWCAYIPSVFNEGIASVGEYFGFILSPGSVFAGLELFNELGVWSIGSMSNTGTFGKVVWGIEALLIIGIPLLLSGASKVVPYSETYRKFYPKYVVPHVYHALVPPVELAQTLLDEGVGAFAKLLTEPQGNKVTRFELYQLEGETTHYLDIVETTVTQDSDGKEKTSDRVVVDNLALSTERANAIRHELGAATPAAEEPTV